MYHMQGNRYRVGRLCEFPLNYPPKMSEKKSLPIKTSHISTKSFSQEKNPTKRSLTAWGSLYQKLLSRKKSYQKIPDCLRKSLPKASLKKKTMKKILPKDPWLPEEVSTKSFSLEKHPTKRSLPAWWSLYQKLLSRKKNVPKDPWLPEEVSTKSFSLEKKTTKRSLTAWGSLYQKLLSRKKILPKDPWLPEEVSTKSFSLETQSYQKIPDCLRKSIPKASL